MEITAAQIHIFVQLGLAVLLGSIIGIERTLAHSLAGFRTFAMVSLGSCLFTIIGSIILPIFGHYAGFSPSFLIGQVIVGVGFLAGGLLVLNKDRAEGAHGLTTSTGLWVAAGIGMAVGFDQYAIAIFASLLTILIFGLFWHVERRIVANNRHEHDYHGH